MPKQSEKKIIAFVLGLMFFLLGLIVGLIWDAKGKDYWKYFAIGAVINIVLIVVWVGFWSSIFWWAFIP